MNCAYCSEPGALTKEHVWPRWLHASADRSLKYHAAPNKVLPSEQVVNDVCARCNNGPLSDLDGYARSLYARYFGKRYETAKRSIFRYDFEKLSRWLLKTSYNTARAARSPDADLLGQYASCIVTPSSVPAYVDLSVSLMGQMIVIDPASGRRTTTELTWCRSGYVGLTLAQSAAVIARIVIIHCWCFMIVVRRNGAGPIDEALLRPLLPGQKILPGGEPTRVPTVTFDADGVLGHFREKRHLYEAARMRRKPNR